MAESTSFPLNFPFGDKTRISTVAPTVAIGSSILNSGSARTMSLGNNFLMRSDFDATHLSLSLPPKPFDIKLT